MNTTIDKNIIEILGLQTATKEKQEEVVGELGALIMQLSLVKATEKMSDEALIAFEKVLAKQKPEEIGSFLEKTTPEFDALVAEASKEIVEEYKKG